MLLPCFYSSKECYRKEVEVIYCSTKSGAEREAEKKQEG